VEFAGRRIAESRRAWWVLETSHPPVYYIPPGDIELDVLEPATGATVCEWKGAAKYYDLVLDDLRSERAAWSYLNPVESFKPIRGFVAFYAGKVDACWVDGKPVKPQEGAFYGGWITDDLAGPFKGEPGSSGW
jgi:uncharacterized protein (DUF427 family)